MHALSDICVESTLYKARSEKLARSTVRRVVRYEEMLASKADFRQQNQQLGVVRPSVPSVCDSLSAVLTCR